MESSITFTLFIHPVYNNYSFFIALIKCIIGSVNLVAVQDNLVSISVDLLHLWHYRCQIAMFFSICEVNVSLTFQIQDEISRSAGLSNLFMLLP